MTATTRVLFFAVVASGVVAPAATCGDERDQLIQELSLIHIYGCARGARAPKTNADYWRAKITRNRLRDVAALAELRDNGWDTAVVWECELADMMTLEKRLRAFLRNSDT